MNQPKLKKKPHALSRALSDQELQNHPYSIKRKLISTSRGELQDIYENKKGMAFTIQDSKLIHNINLQIPSLNSPSSLSFSSTNNNSIKSACIKGMSKRIPIKSPKEIKKTGFDKDEMKFFDSEGNGTKEENKTVAQEIKSIEIQLKKALDENRKLKKTLQEDNLRDDIIDDMMKSFKSRLYKLLYE